jgi:hypothetical protein
MPPTPDLHARILAAIERVEVAAVAATPGPWTVSHRRCTVFSGAHPVADYIDMRSGNAAHIVLNEPTTVLRRCAADRRILNAHRTTVFNDLVHGHLYSCEACHRFTDEGTSRSWCDTVLALAEGYGITVDGES